jgi:hypothetical protein
VTSNVNSEFSGNGKKRSCREKKPTVYEDLGYVEKDKLKGAKNPLLADIAKKCERGFAKIKKHPFAEFFLNPVSPETPSLSQIEKNLKNYVYQSTYQFGLELRKLWSYYFATYTNMPEIFQRTCKLSEFSEEVLKEIESSREDKSDIKELSEKVEKLTKEIKEIHKGGQPTPQAPPKKGDKSGSALDKPMTMAEKNALGNSIRSLTPDQLKGIVNILSDSLVIDPQSKYFEFDIETLSTRKLRELELYVRKCLKSKSAPPKQPETKVQKKPSTNTAGDGADFEKIAQLKSDLAIKESAKANQALGSQYAQQHYTPQQNIPTATAQQQQLKRPITQRREEEIKDSKNVFSESDGSLSSSEESGKIEDFIINNFL